MVKEKIFRSKKRGFLLILLIALLTSLLGFLLGMQMGRKGNPNLSGGQMPPIYPSIYITGSSGKISSIDPIVRGVIDDKDTKAKRGLEIVVDADNKLTISGKISPMNHYPTIEVGMENGTNNSLKYEAALKSVMTYLSEHYRIPFVNVMGYSAGGSGVYRYLLQYGNDSSLPSVEKFVSLDGQYNASTAQPNQSLEEVLKSGPLIKTKYYQYWEQNYTKLDSNIQVTFLEGAYDIKNETDGVVPWADTFSIYHFFSG
ncbi:alpha/beta hydrolase [Lactococcus fujiensis]|uniref:alpha/beta hydrolase n=1 Tax=Lactococcus fujiensis TaxID=610251 RepID=UPI000AD9ADFA|nr:alpha/beta hydrolase [Lactococcus fujiensis]